VGVIRQATANPLDLSAGVMQLMTKVRNDLPPGVSIEVANDNSVFIDRSIKSVYTTIAEAVVLVALVILVFLRTFRASIIPLLTIPVSLIGAFGLMALAGSRLAVGGLLVLYGPYREAEVPLAASNAAFDDSLKARDPAWGLRDRDAVATAAKAEGLALTRRVEMPANNLMLLFRRV
jgi:hypothetical protein